MEGIVCFPQRFSVLVSRNVRWRRRRGAGLFPSLAGVLTVGRRIVVVGITDIVACRLIGNWEVVMKTQYSMSLTLLAGVAIGAIAVQGLHAQANKLKAYSVGELEPIAGAKVSAAYLDGVRKAIVSHHGRALRTVNGRVVKIEGAEPPKIAAIVEWDSLDDALAFYHSKEWTDLAPERDKAQKAIRRYVVEVEP
jgi:uncharacterized protein (DUF1330 family)